MVTVAMKYINRYIWERDFPAKLDQLETMCMEYNHFQNPFRSIGYWFASTSFRTQENTRHGDKSKEENFKQMKEAFKLRFTHHELSAPNQPDCFTEMKRAFLEQYKRYRIKNADVSEVRKSEQGAAAL